MIYITSSILIIIILIIILAFLLLALIYKNKLTQSGGEFNSLKNFFVQTKSAPTIIPTATMVLLFNSWFYKNNNKNPLDFEFDVISTIKNSMDNSNKSNNSNLCDKKICKLNPKLCLCCENIFSNCCQPESINSNPIGPLIKFNTFLYNNQLFTLSPNQLSVSARTYSDSFYDLYLLSKNEKIKYAISVCEINSNIYLQIDEEKIGGGNNLITFYYTDPENFALIDDFKDSCEKIINDENMESSTEEIEELSSKRPPKLDGSSLFDDYTQFKINDKKFNIIKFNPYILNNSSKNIFNIKYYSNKKNVDIFLDFSYGDNQNIELNFYNIHKFTYLILNKIINYLDSSSSKINDYTFIIGLLMTKNIEWNKLFEALEDDFQFKENEILTNKLIKSLLIEKNNSQFYLLNFNNYDKSPTNLSSTKQIVIPPSKSFDMDEFLRIATDKLVMNIQIEHSEEYFRHKSNIVEFIMRILNQKISNFSDEIKTFLQFLQFFGFYNNKKFQLKFIDVNSINVNFLSNSIFNKSNHKLFLYLLKKSSNFTGYKLLFKYLLKKYSNNEYDDKLNEKLNDKLIKLIKLINDSETIKLLNSEKIKSVNKLILKHWDSLIELVNKSNIDKSIDKSLTDLSIDESIKSVNDLFNKLTNLIQKSNNNSSIKSIDKSANEIIDKSANEIIDLSANEIIDKSVDELIDKSVDEIIHKSENKSDKSEIESEMESILINFEKFLLGVPIISKIKNKTSITNKEFSIKDPCCVINFDKTFPKK